MRPTIKKISDTVTPDLTKIIQALSANGKRQLLVAAVNEFLKETQSNFGSSGGYRDKPWAPLSKNYAKKVKRSSATLVKSGELRDSIKMQLRSEYALIYTTNKYAAAQAFGYKPNRLPARNFWPMQNFGTPSYGRLVFNADRDIFNVISRKLNVLSYNALPLITTLPARSTPDYGSPFTSPT